MSSRTTRLELIKNNRTITKVIFNQKGNALDVKLCIPCNDYYIKGYKLFDENPITGRVTKSEDVNIEVSYHSKKNNLLPKIHLKINEDSGPVYKTIPITRLSSPSIDSFAPFPLFKIEIPDTSLDVFKETNQFHKKEYKRFDICHDYKVIEAYIISKESKALERYEPYDKSFRFFLSSNFESLCTNKVDGKKTPFFFKDKNYQSIRDEIVADLGDFRIAIITSIFPSLEKIIDKPVITFIENELSEAIFFHSLIKLSGASIEPGKFLIGNMSKEHLLAIATDDVEKYWEKNSYLISYIEELKIQKKEQVLKRKHLSIYYY